MVEGAPHCDTVSECEKALCDLHKTVPTSHMLTSNSTDI